MSFFGRIRKLGRLNEKIDEELRFHLEEKERRLIADGLSLADARREGRKAFGSQAAVREYTRDAWIFRWADDLWRDLRFAARGLRRSPGFTAVAVLTLALGIGACTTIFTFVNALLLKDLPVRNPEELVWLGVDEVDGPWGDAHSYRLYEMLNEGNGPFRGFATVNETHSGITVDGSTQLIDVHLVSGEYFRLLGGSAAAGRLLNAGDIEGADGAVAVLRYGFWRDRFGADPSIVGRTITLGGLPFTVAGIAQPGFVGTDAARPADVWSTIDQVAALRDREDWRSVEARWLRIFGRRAPGTTTEQGQAYVSTIYERYRDVQLQSVAASRRLELERRYSSETIRLKPVSATNPVDQDAYSQQFMPLAAAVGLVLLLCSANVANLLLGRGFKRRHEFGLRLATGASRWRVVRQLLAEGLLLGLLGSALGVGLAVVSTRYFHQEIGTTWTPKLDISPDWSVALFTSGVSALCVILAALYPAVNASRIPLAQALRGARGDSCRTLGARGLLVAVQFALCLPLLVAAGLLIQTVENLFSQDVGFARAQRLHATVGLYASGLTNERGLAALNELLAELKAQDGFSSVGFSMFGTLGSSYATASMPVPSSDGDKRQVSVSWSYLSEGYFETMGVPLLGGRDFRPSDTGGAPEVAIVNQSFARELETDNPVGTRLGEMEIVGLVPDAKDHDLREPAPPQIFYPFRQSTNGFPLMQIYVRSDMNVDSFRAIVGKAASRLNPTILVDGFSTIDGVIEAGMQRERTTSSLLGGFSFLALIIAAVGLYSVIAFDVSRRTQEIGLRIALGAQTTDIQSMVFRRAAPWVLGGCVVGLAGAAAMTRLLEAKLFGVAALDPLTFALAAAFLLLCAGAANYVPARRAAAVEPMTALRHD